MMKQVTDTQQVSHGEDTKPMSPSTAKCPVLKVDHFSASHEFLKPRTEPNPQTPSLFHPNSVQSTHHSHSCCLLQFELRWENFHESHLDNFTDRLTPSAVEPTPLPACMGVWVWFPYPGKTSSLEQGLHSFSWHGWMAGITTFPFYDQR